MSTILATSDLILRKESLDAPRLAPFRPARALPGRKSEILTAGDGRLQARRCATSLCGVRCTVVPTLRFAPRGFVACRHVVMFVTSYMRTYTHVDSVPRVRAHQFPRGGPGRAAGARHPTLPRRGAEAARPRTSVKAARTGPTGDRRTPLSRLRPLAASGKRPAATRPPPCGGAAPGPRVRGCVRLSRQRGLRSS